LAIKEDIQKPTIDTCTVLKMLLWYNENITIENKSVFYKDWYVKGFIVVNDPIKNRNTKSSTDKSSLYTPKILLFKMIQK